MSRPRGDRAAPAPPSGDRDVEDKDSTEVPMPEVGEMSPDQRAKLAARYGMTAAQFAEWLRSAKWNEEEYQTFKRRRAVAKKRRRATAKDRLAKGPSTGAGIIEALDEALDLVGLGPVNALALQPTGASHGRRGRPPSRATEALLEVVQGLLDQQTGPISIRHLFYLCVSARAVEKTELGYKRLKHHLTVWRRAGEIEWSAFADATRWYYGSRGHGSASDYLAESIRLYRYNLWAERDVHLEIWAEKDAICSILLEAADPWRVQVFPFRGFTSLTSLYHAARTFRAMQAQGKEVYVYYFGDYDPSGVDIDRAAVAALRNDFRVDINFERMAVTPEQIETLGLPTRPTKVSDSRTRGANPFVGQSVEVDAMARDQLMTLVTDCITQHLPADEYERMQAAEATERDSLDQFLRGWTRRRRARA